MWVFAALVGWEVYSTMELALANYSPAPAEFELRPLPIRELPAGMVLAKDVLRGGGEILCAFRPGSLAHARGSERHSEPRPSGSGSGNVIVFLKEGTVLRRHGLKRLGDLVKFRASQGLVPVRISSLNGLGRLSRPA